MEQYFDNLSIILKELRTSNGLTQKQIAKNLGITYQSYQAYERKTAIPSLPILIKLAEFYDVSLDYLLGRKEY